MAKEFSVRADGFTAIFSLAPLLLMSLSDMIVQDTQPASLLPLPSLPDESEEAAPASAFAQLLNMFLAPPPAAQIAPSARADSATSAAFSMLPSAAPAPASDPAHLIGAEVIRLDEKSLSIRDLPALPTSELSGFTIAESAATAPTLAGAALLQRDLKSLSVSDLPELPTSELSGFTIAESAATAPTLAGAELLQRDGKSLSVSDLPELPTSELSGFTIADSAATTPTLAGAALLQRNRRSLSVSGLPELPTSELSGFMFAESAATTPTFAGPVIETSQEAAGVARSQATVDTQSTDGVDAAPVIMARRPRRDEEPPANDLAETGLAGTPQMTLTQSPIGVALPAMFEASAKSELTTDMRRSASPLSKSAGLDGSAMPRSPIVDMPTSLASETATAVERQPLGPLNQANDDLTTKQQVELPIAARKAPARSDDRDSFKAQSLRNENHASMAVNDFSIANATAALKQSDGMRHLPFTERPLEIDPEPNPATSGAADATKVKRDAEKSQAGMAAASPGDEHSAAKDGWQGQPREGDAQANPSMVAGAAPARIDESYRGETAAPAWRPMVERLARDIGEHFRVGEQQAVLQLEPPELGRVKIDLRIEDGQLHVRIAAEGQESQGLIEDHLPELHQALCAGQIDVGAVRVSQGEWNGGGALAQNFSQSPQGRPESPRGLASSGVGDEAMTEPSAQPPRSADGRISMWA